MVSIGKSTQRYLIHKQQQQLHQYDNTERKDLEIFSEEEMALLERELYLR